MQRPVGDLLNDPVFQSFNQSSAVQLLRDDSPPAIAVAVSGGPDSMALLYLLTRLENGPEIYTLTVDHGMRAEATDEAKQVGTWIAGWPKVHHHILTWVGNKPDSAVMEQARESRYELMVGWCLQGLSSLTSLLPTGGRESAGRSIRQLWLGHNRTDQAETFLFRLAKGSGLDGLSGMRERQRYRETGLTLVRPLLDVAKDDLRQFCLSQAIPHVQDPTNVNPHYARTRLRQSLPVLEAEGLSEKRLAVTASRLARARDALDHYAQAALGNGDAFLSPQKSSISLQTLTDAPEEIRIRIVRHMLERMEGGGYGPRLERLEESLAAFFKGEKAGKSFTLGGFLFARNKEKTLFIITPEA